MKRFIFSAIALVMAATACTESGLIDTPQLYSSEIVFDTYIGKTPVTKAESINLAYLKNTADNNPGGAHVYAFMTEKDNRNTASVDYSSAYMNGDLIWNATASTPSWEYKVNGVSEEVYWPGDVDMAFVAYNKAAESCMIDNTQTLTGFDFEIKDDISNQVDLLATPVTFVHENNSGDTSVGLTFHHLLSRVGFSVIATNPNSSVDIAIQSLRFCGMFPTKGYVDLTSTNASIRAYETGAKATFTTYYDFFESNQCFTVNSSTCGSTASENSRIYANKKYVPAGTNWDNIYVTPTAAEFTPNANDRFMMIMPGQLDGAKIEVVYQLTGAEPRSAKVDLGNVLLKPGYAYEFVLRVATASIEFSGVVEGDWGTTGTNGNTDIPQGN